MSTRVFLILVFVLIADGAAAGVWRVEQDGSGDFMVIQDAVDAAASGDTILIGPGRYDDLQIRGSMTGTTVAYWGDGRDLTFIGESVDEVIIGPTSYVPDGTGPQGLHQHADADVRIETLRFENLAAGIVTGRGDLIVEDSQFEMGSEGLFVQDPDTCIVSNCSFSGFDNYSITTYRAVYAEVIGCELTDAVINFNAADNGIVRDCTVTSGSLVRYYRSQGRVEGCNAQCDDNDPCISVSDSDTVRFYDNVIAGGSINMSIGGANTNVFAERNDFSAPSIYNFDLGGNASLYAHDNHINRSSSMINYIVYTTAYSEAYSPTIDMGSNYWFADGTIPGRLDDLIHDGNDDAELHIFVNYDPIRTEPVPAKKTSFGGIKALFR